MHFVIIGNGVAGIEAAFTLRRRHNPRQATITVVSAETDFFFSRTALMYAFMDVMTRRDLEPYERGFYDAQAITLRRARAVDLDADTHTLTLDDGEQLHYDKLLLAVGAKPRHVPFAGIDQVQDGLVNFVSMQDLDACERLAWDSQQAVVVGGGLIGIELVECLNFHGIHTTFLVREPYYWPAALHAEEAGLVEEHIRAHGVDLRTEEELASIEVDARGRVSGIVTNLGDTIPCQMLGICIGVVANSDWLASATTPPAIGRGIRVNRAFETSLPDVYAAGDCAEIDLGAERPLIETIWYSAKLHGRLAAESMLGDDVRYSQPLFYNSSKFFEIEYTTVGDVVRAPAGSTSLYRHLPGSHITQRIVVDPQGHVIGFNMLGSRFNHAVLESWIRQRRDLDFVRKHLHQAQFDVEFGRAPLDRMTEQELAL